VLRHFDQRNNKGGMAWLGLGEAALENRSIRVM
jgi:hypothetical protein